MLEKKEMKEIDDIIKNIPDKAVLHFLNKKDFLEKFRGEKEKPVLNGWTGIKKGNHYYFLIFKVKKEQIYKN